MNDSRVNNADSVFDPLLTQFNHYLAEHTGLYFPAERRVNLELGLRNAALALNWGNINTFLQRLMEASPSRQQIEQLAGFLTVGETHFFRDEKTYQALEEQVLKDLILERQEGGRYLRLWCAGCASGEEPYSIMMLLDRLLPAPSDWHVRLLATDINLEAIGKARRGVYGNWSFRGTSASLKRRYFTELVDGCFELDASIRDRVSFAYLNLADDVYPSLSNYTNAVDIIFCRNVMMYFAPAVAQRVFKNLHRCLVNGGWLVVSPTDAPEKLPDDCLRVNYPGAIFYRRTTNAADEWSGPPYCIGETQAPENQPDVQASPKVDATATLHAIEPGWIHTVARGEQPPESKIECLLRARRLYKQGHYADAAELLLPLAGKGEVLSTATLLIEALSNCGRIGEALDWCDKAVNCNRLEPELYYLQAILRQELGDDVDAAESLRSAVFLSPDFTLAHFTLGKMLHEQGRQKEASKYFRTVLSILKGCADDELLDDFDGLPVGSLRAIIASIQGGELAA